MALNGWEDGSIGGLIVAIVWIVVHWLQARQTTQTPTQVAKKTKGE
jgi:hypothetical protein